MTAKVHEMMPCDRPLTVKKTDCRPLGVLDAFNGLITMTSFFVPAKTAKPSKIKLLPYPVPAQKMLSYP